ncbi:MAG: hypothetical protein EXR72_05670 [Myxococcales bacterium]|nr:hypothetical protein [Myxococcales bacterium]
MIDTLDEARAFLDRHRVITMVRADGMPSFVDEVAGERVRGSWWGHPRGKRIYALVTQLEDEGDLLSLHLVDGRVTLLARALWPHLYRV